MEVFWEEAVAVARAAMLLSVAAAWTVIVTLDGLEESCPSLTTSWKVRLVADAGAVKVGLATVVEERIDERAGGLRPGVGQGVAAGVGAGRAVEGHRGPACSPSGRGRRWRSGAWLAPPLAAYP